MFYVNYSLSSASTGNPPIFCTFCDLLPRRCRCIQIIVYRVPRHALRRFILQICNPIPRGCKCIQIIVYRGVELNKMPPLCKGRWQNESFDGGIEHLLTTTKLDNPPVFLLRKNPAPFTQGGLWFVRSIQPH